VWVWAFEAGGDGSGIYVLDGGRCFIDTGTRRWDLTGGEYLAHGGDIGGIEY